MSEKTFNTFRVDTSAETFMVGQRQYNWEDVSSDPVPVNIFIDDTIGDVTYEDENGETRVIENLESSYTQAERKEFTDRFEYIKDDWGLIGFPYAEKPAYGHCSLRYLYRGEIKEANCRSVGGDYKNDGPQGVVVSLYNGKYFLPGDVSVDQILQTGTPEAASDFFGYVMEHQDEFWQIIGTTDDPDNVSKTYEMLAQAANYWIQIGSEESPYYEDAVALAVNLLGDTSILPSQRYKWFCVEYFHTEADGTAGPVDRETHDAALSAPQDVRLAEAIASLMEEISLDDASETREFSVVDYYHAEQDAADRATKNYYDYDRGKTLGQSIDQSVYLNDPTILDTAKSVVDQWIATGSDDQMDHAIAWLANQANPLDYQAEFQTALARAESEGNVQALACANHYAARFPFADYTRVVVSDKLLALSHDHQDKTRALAAGKALIEIGSKSEGIVALKKLAYIGEPNKDSFEAAIEVWKLQSLAKYKPEIYGEAKKVDVRTLPKATDSDRGIFLKCLWHPQAYGTQWDWHAADGLDWKPLTDFDKTYSASCGRQLMAWLTVGMDEHEKLAFETRVQKLLEIYGLTLF